MWFTRLGYFLIVCVIASAAVAIAYVLRPSDASQPPPIEFDSVVNFAKFGVIESVDVKGQTMTVRFKDGFDTKAQFGVSDHVFLGTIPAGRDIVAALTAAGVPLNDGLQVHQR